MKIVKRTQRKCLGCPAWILGILGFLDLAGEGCAGKRPALLDSPGGPLGSLEALREQEGIGAWKKYSYVRFAYKISIRGIGQEITCPEVAFRTSDYRRLWVSFGAQRPAAISLAGPPGSESGVKADVALDPRGLLGLDFALRSVRYFFALPLATSVGRWEFRRLLGPRGVPSSTQIEIKPLEPFTPLGECILGERGPDGLLTRIVYASLHPFAAEAPQVLVLEDYQPSGGVQVARRRAHAPAPREDSSAPPADPFPEVGRAPEEDRWLLREEITDVAFFEEKAGKERYKERNEE